MVHGFNIHYTTTSHRAFEMAAVHASNNCEKAILYAVVFLVDMNLSLCFRLEKRLYNSLRAKCRTIMDDPK